MSISDPYALIPYFTYQDTLVTVNTTVGIVVNANPSRVALIFAASNINSCWIGISNQITANHGIFCTSGVTPLQLHYKDVGSLVQLDWYGLAQNQGQNLYVIEVFYKPRGD